MMHGQMPHDAGSARPAFPLRLVFWELTARCNLRCAHCRASAQEGPAAGELTTAEALRVAEEIRAAGDPILVLTGGEPLARGDFFDIATHCTGLFTRVALATNGTLVDQELAARIAATGIQRASLSLDGAQAQTHDAFRGVPRSYDAAWRGFDALRAAGVSVQVNMTVTRQNLSELPALLDLALARGADALHVFMLVPVGCGAELPEEVRLTPTQSDAVLRWLFTRSVELQGRLHIKPTCAPQYFRIMREVAREAGLPLPQGHGMQAMTRGCLAGSGVCFISRTGDVQPCGYLPVAAGNVRQTPLGMIWRDSALFAALRDPDQLTGKCGACPFRRSCQGCRARAYAASGDYLGEEPECPYQPAEVHGGR